MTPMANKYLGCVLALLILAGCEQANSGADQCLRTELFERCLARIPVGPTTVHHNDWAEVVDECETSAYYQSLRHKKHIKPECRASY